MIWYESSCVFWIEAVVLVWILRLKLLLGNFSQMRPNRKQVSQMIFARLLIWVEHGNKTLMIILGIQEFSFLVLIVLTLSAFHLHFYRHCSNWHWSECAPSFRYSVFVCQTRVKSDIVVIESVFFCADVLPEITCCPLQYSVPIRVLLFSNQCLYSWLSSGGAGHMHFFHRVNPCPWTDTVNFPILCPPRNCTPKNRTWCFSPSCLGHTRYMLIATLKPAGCVRICNQFIARRPGARDIAVYHITLIKAAWKT